MVVFLQSGCIWAKVDVFRQSGCIPSKVVVLGQKCLYSGKSSCVGGNIDCIRAKWLYY